MCDFAQCRMCVKLFKCIFVTFSPSSPALADLFFLCMYFLCNEEKHILRYLFSLLLTCCLIAFTVCAVVSVEVLSLFLSSFRLSFSNWVVDP